MGYTVAQITAIRAKAVEIAEKGYTYVQVGDRSYKFTDFMKLEEFALIMEANILDDTQSGVINLKMQRPS